MMVEPTKLKPRFLRSLLNASETVLRAGMSLRVRHGVLQRHAVDEAPLVVRETAKLFLDPQEGARILHGRFELESVSHDARVLHQTFNPLRSEARDALHVEVGERGSVRPTFAQHGEPTQPACAPSKVKNSNSTRSSCTGTPHSLS